MNDTTAENLIWKAALSNNKSDRIKYAKQLIKHARGVKRVSDNREIVLNDMTDKLTLAAGQIKRYKDTCFALERMMMDKYYNNEGENNENI